MRPRRAWAVALMVLALQGCGGGGPGAAPAPGGAAGTVIGPAGGTALGPGGAKVEIPPGALSAETTIVIEQDATDAPALPVDFSAMGLGYALKPHGTRFARPVRLTLPFDGHAIRPGMRPALYKTDSKGLWRRVHEVRFEATALSAEITSFSFGQPGIELRECPRREWVMLPTKQFGEHLQPWDIDEQTCGEVVRPFIFGGAEFEFFQDAGPPGLAIGEVYSSADASSFSAYAEAPSGAPAIPEFRSGGFALLRQFQSYVKRSPDATLQLVLTHGFLAAADFNGRPLDSECRHIRDLQRQSDEEIVQTCWPLMSRFEFRAAARKGSRGPEALPPFFSTAGQALLFGFDGKWVFDASPVPGRSERLWTEANFVTQLGGQIPSVDLKTPLVIDVDLSSVELCPPDQAAIFCTGKDFTVFTMMEATSWNWRGRESAAAAFLRDPQRFGGRLVATGLEATNNPTSLASDEAPPPPCTSGPDPQAGQLQFSAQRASVLEGVGVWGVRDLKITRTQGSRGAVSVDVRSRAGTALADVDFDPLALTVAFADGDDAPRTVRVGIRANDVIEPDRSLTLELSNPGGCAVLGALSTATLTILDDDKPAPPPPPSGLDAGFGTSGKAVADRFGGDRSAMALQPDGRIVMVGGTFADFILARFHADGTLDASFGQGGQVVTDMGGALAQEEALGVALQADGRIVVVGHASTAGGAARFALARYLSDGNLDDSFAASGKLVSEVVGRARAVAIQPDGKLVLVGDDGGLEDVKLARFHADGRLDASFGRAGMVATDIAGSGDVASNVVLEPDGGIVVSGSHSDGTTQQTVLARYRGDGSLDTRFGNGGTLTLPGVRVGEGLVRQRDGKYVLGGSAPGDGAATPQFALLRLDPNGSLDTRFGSAGTVRTNLSGRGDLVNAVAVQADGKIVAGGVSGMRVNPNFAITRYRSDGTLDTGFAVEGALVVDFFGVADVGESILVQRDGKIVLGGLARNIVDGYGIVRANP